MQQANSQTFSLTTLPKIGDPLPGGAFVGLMLPTEHSAGYLLILPPIAEKDQQLLRWSNDYETVEGLSDWDGAANTAILAAGDHPAAKYCAEFTADGLNDFYLPSHREAAAISAQAGHLFKSGWHWTSTQYSADDAFVQDFAGGDQSYGYMDGKYLVRPVRRVAIQ